MTIKKVRFGFLYWIVCSVVLTLVFYFDCSELAFDFVEVFIVMYLIILWYRKFKKKWEPWE